MGTMLTKAKSLSALGLLDARLQAALDYAQPGWTTASAPRSTSENMHAISAFRAEHDRYPHHRAADDDERRLGEAWEQIKLRHRKGTMSAADAARAEALFGAAWSERVNVSAADTVREVFAFNLQHRHFPRISGPDEAEKLLAYSWRDIKSRHRQGRLPAGAAALGNELFGPAWSDRQKGKRAHGRS